MVETTVRTAVSDSDDMDSPTQPMDPKAHRLLCGDVCPEAEPPLALYSAELHDIAKVAAADVLVSRGSAGAYARRACPRRTVMGGDGAGSAEESHRALRAAHALTFSCSRCGALIDFLASCRAAAENVRAKRPARSGCASARCSARSRPGAFAGGQRKMARAILDGKRILIRAPTSTNLTTVSVVCRAEAIGTAQATLAAHVARA